MTTKKAAQVVATATDTTPHDGEQIGILTFDVRADWALHRGLWVYPASYRDWTLCRRRADHLTASFGVPFYVVPITPRYLADGGASPAIDCPGYYCATPAESTPALRRIIGRAMARAAALRGPDGEVRP